MNEERSEPQSPESGSQPAVHNKLRIRRKTQASDSTPTATSKAASAAKTSPDPVDIEALSSTSQVPRLQLGRRHRKIAAIGGGILLLTALLLLLSTFVFSLAAALLLNSFTWPLSSRLRRRGLAPLAAIIITYLAGVVILGLLMLAATPAWQRSGEAYASHLVEAAETLSSRLIAPSEEPVETEIEPSLAEQLVGEAQNLTEQLAPGVDWAMKRFLQPTAYVAAHRIRIFFQMSLLLALINIFPIILGKDLADPNDKLQTILALPHRLTRWLIIKFGSRLNRRLLKALIPATMVGAGIKAAGLEVGLFLAVITFILSLFFAWGGAIGIILSGPALLFEPFLLHPLLVLGIILIILFFLEHRLHWRLVAWPKALEQAAKAPNNLIYPVSGGKGINWQRWLRNAIYIFILILIGYTFYTLLPPLLEQRELERQLHAGQVLLADDSYSLAAEKFSEILEEHPEETRALIGLVKIHAYGESPNRALEYAEKLDEVAARPEVAPSGFREQIVNFLINLIYSPETADPVEAYEIIEKNVVR